MSFFTMNVLFIYIKMILNNKIKLKTDNDYEKLF